MTNSIFTSPDMKQKVTVILGISAVLGVIELLNILFGYALNPFGGLYPREVFGLVGIVASPFLHGSLSHLLSNIFPFMVLGGLIIMNGVSHFVKVSLYIMVATGSLVWVLGPSATIIVGASGVIFGYLGYLLANGYIYKTPTDILIALAVLFMYGGMIVGVFPGAPGVSWEAHLAGFISGLGTAVLVRKK
jgi:membrane associated rhomboid family serine protease